MQLSKLPGTLSWISHSIRFFARHAVVILGLGLIAAFGRATQLGAFGTITSFQHVVLEVMIECSRVFIFLYTIGQTRFMNGFMKFAQLLTNKGKRRENWQVFSKQFRAKWPGIMLNIVVFMVIASLINYLIDLAAYETCMYAALKANRVITEQSSEWVLLLFMKNISVIPLTLVFNAVFLLWMTNKLAGKPGEVV